ncbi:MAG: hypothetical protein Q9198_001936 [Flavoplaca austrocitrina]
MQFKNIIAFVSLASMAAALPAEVEKRTPQNQCSQQQTAKCCDQLVKNPLVTAINVQLLQGINCVNVNVVGVLNDGQCSQSQTLACCSSGAQNGLVNVGNVCTPVTVG